MTPYTDLSFSHSSSSYSAGLRYALDTGLDLDFKATHLNPHSSADTDNRLFLQLRMDLYPHRSPARLTGANTGGLGR